MTTATKPAIEQVYLQLVEDARRLRDEEVASTQIRDREMARACDAAAIAVEEARRKVRAILSHLLAGYR